MKKILLTLLLALTFSAAYAQIQRTFLGFKLGQTTMSEIVAEANSSRQTLQMVKGQPNTYAIHYKKPIQFGTLEWNVVQFTFVGEKLAEVSFVSTKEAKKRYAFLKHALETKYADLKKADTQTKEDKDFNKYVVADRGTTVTLTYIHAEKPNRCTVKYSDNGLVSEHSYSGSGLDEL